MTDFDQLNQSQRAQYRAHVERRLQQPDLPVPTRLELEAVREELDIIETQCEHCN